MKSNKKLFFLLAISMVSPWQLANAGALDDLEIISAGSNGGASSETGTSSNISSEESEISSIQNKDCQKTLEKNNVINMQTLKFISGGELPRIIPHDDKEFKITLKSFPQKCVVLKINRILDENNNHIFRFVNSKEYSNDDFFEYENGNLKSGKSIPSSNEEKFASCLKKHYGEVDPVTKKVKINFNSDKVSDVSRFLKLHTDLNKEKSSKILFASPSNDKNDYFSYDKKVINDKNEIWQCSTVQAYGDTKADAEKDNYVAKKIFRSKYDLEWEKARAACEVAKSGKIRAIANLMDKDTGNRSELQKKIREVYLKLKEKDIYTEADRIRDEIEEKLTKIQKYDNPLKSSHVKKAKQLAKEIKELSEEYTKNVIEPAREVLEHSHAEYEGLSEDDIDSPRREALEDRIETLTGKLSEFETVDMSDGVQVMKLHNRSKAGEELLKASKGSEYLSNACLDCEEQMDFEDVDDALEARMLKFKKKGKKGWKYTNLAARGKSIPLEMTKRSFYSSQNNMKSAYTNFQKKEQTDYQKYCGSSMIGGMKNPVRCQYFQNSQGMRHKMFQSRMSSMQRNMEGYNKEYSYYQSYYDGAQRYLAEQDRDIASVNHPNGSVYDNFSILGGSTGNQSGMYDMGMPPFALDLMR
jgi:hypothetical protein